MTELRELELVGDLADAQSMPDASGVRRGGDRRRRRARGIAAGAALAVAAVIAVPAVDGATDRQSAPPAENDKQGRQDAQVVRRDSGLSGWRLAHQYAVADEGIVFAAEGSLWVADRRDGEVDPATGKPEGVLHRIDPATGLTTATVPGAVGGWPVQHDNAIWLATPSTDLLSRVDLDTLELTTIDTSPTEQPGLRGFVFAGGWLWANNMDDGTLTRLDPRTYAITKTIDFDLPAEHDGAMPPILWHGRIWTMVQDTDEIVQVDPSAGRIVSRQTNPARNVGGALVVLRDRIAVLSGTSLTFLEVSDSGVLSTGRHVDLLPGAEEDVGPLEAYGSLWLTSWSGGELVQLDPTTYAVRGRVDIPTTGPQNDVSPTTTAAYGSVWVRVFNRLLEFRPTGGSAAVR